MSETAGSAPRPRGLARFVDVRPGEGRMAALSALYFFLLLCAYYILRPLRDALGVSGDVRKLPWLYVGTLTTMLALQPVFGWLVSRTARRTFITWTYRFFGASLLVFLALLSAQGLEKGGMAAKVFFVWVSVFNLFVISVFWGFMADIWRSEQGKRLFGVIGVGGTLGAIVGAAMTGALATALPAGAAHWVLLGSAALLECAVWVARALSRAVQEAGAPEGAGAVTEPKRADAELAKGGALGGLKAVGASTYLLGICVFMSIFPFSSTIVYFEQAKLVSGAFTDTAARTAAFARIDRDVNILTLALQLFATGRLIRWIGLGRTMALLPIITMGGLAALAVWPTFLTLAWFQVVRRGSDYGVARPAREALYTVVPRDQKYKAKAFIDTFVYRTADVAGALASGLFDRSGLSHAGVAGVFAPLAAIWVGVSLWLGKKQKKMAAMPPPAPSCSRCGYELSGLGGGVCPECGSPIAR